MCVKHFATTFPSPDEISPVTVQIDYDTMLLSFTVVTKFDITRKINSEL
jgi:hypothetical protein